MKNESKLEEINVPDNGRTFRINHVDIALLVGSCVCIGIVIGVAIGVAIAKFILQPNP